MKIAPAVLTWNAIATGRKDLLYSTVESIRAAGVDCHVVTNGSTDGTDKLVREFPKGIVDNTNASMHYGLELAIRAAASESPDVIMFSADDLTYHDDWYQKLAAFWSEAPEDVVLACCFLEDEWEWNRPTGTVDAGGVRGLIRESVPSASWTFRLSDLDKILPIPQKSPGEDLEKCRQLRAAGYRLAQLDLATHDGIEVSAWGNKSHLYANPLDRERWGI